MEAMVERVLQTELGGVKASVNALQKDLVEYMSAMKCLVSNISLIGIKITKDIFSMFNLIGCPLLLACMCIERYVVVIRPVLCLRLRRWEYCMAVSATAWMLTLSFCLVIGLMQDMVKMMVPVSIIISCLFLLMLASLGVVVRSLWQQSPTLTSYAKQTPHVSPLKRRAVGNVLAVVVPSVMSYLPVLVIS
ncbi:uncharacterized protein V3H82_002013 [Fundulus diaphanus]